MDKDRLYGLLILLASIVAAIGFLAAFFAPYLGLPAWLSWWAVALPVFIVVLLALGVLAWIGWTMATTPPPTPIEDLEEPSTEGPEEKR